MITSELSETAFGTESAGTEASLGTDNRQKQTSFFFQTGLRIFRVFRWLGTPVLRWCDVKDGKIGKYIPSLVFIYIVLDLVEYILRGKWPHVIEITGSITCLCFLYVSRSVKDRFKGMTDSLSRRGVIEFCKQGKFVADKDTEVLRFGDDGFQGMQTYLVRMIEKQAGNWSLWSALFFLSWDSITSCPFCRNYEPTMR